MASESYKSWLLLLATLIKDDVFIKTAITNITNIKNQDNVQVKLFISEDEAINWLNSQ